jgi:2-octaprenyl-6-methoxyphenol hydroxylase
MVKTDIAIIGLGVSAKLTALALASENCKVMIFGNSNSSNNYSNLVTFFSKNSINFLKEIGLEDLTNKSIPIKEISCSKLEQYQSEKNFQIHFKEKNSKNDMGRIIINNSLNKSLNDQIKKNRNIVILNDTSITHCRYLGHNTKLILSDGAEIITHMLIITDKKSNLIKENFNNNQLNKELNQTSIVMNVKTDTDGHAYQFFTNKGALAFLPINKKLASVIWSLDNTASELNDDIDTVSKKINEIFISVTNKLEVIDIKKYKLNFNYSRKIISGSIILMGEAAHSLHPIAGQGLNLSIKDIIALKDKIKQFKYLGYSLSNQIILSQFQDERQADNAIFTFATNYLDEIFKSRNFLINTMSDFGLISINKSNFIKNKIIKSATGL